MCTGDFNEILYPHEKEGIRPACKNRILLFRDFIGSNALMDTDLSGCKFTWTGGQRQGIIIRERIDRVLTNWEWRHQYPHVEFQAVPPVSSDHSPVIISTKPKGRSPVLFKYEAFWGDHEQCGQIVTSGWQEASQRYSI